MVIKALDPDPDWIRIRIGIQPKMLDPDPGEMNADPQPCLQHKHVRQLVAVEVPEGGRNDAAEVAEDAGRDVRQVVRVDERQEEGQPQTDAS